MNREALMKKGANRSVFGFTLVELLVVIGIIAILASLLLPAMNAAMRRADISRAKHDMAGIASAIKAYFSEYGMWPTPDTNGNQDHTFVGKEGATTGPIRFQSQIMTILTTNNPRKIVFLEIPKDSLVGTDRKGQNYVASDNFFLDPWGNPYIIVMDSDYDNQIGGFREVLANAVGCPDLLEYINAMSGDGSGAFPGVQVGVMSLGEKPCETNSFLKSW